MHQAVVSVLGQWHGVGFDDLQSHTTAVSWLLDQQQVGAKPSEARQWACHLVISTCCSRGPSGRKRVNMPPTCCKIIHVDQAGQKPGTRLVHEGLREAGLVNLIVAVPPVAHQVNEDVALESADGKPASCQGSEHRTAAQSGYLRGTCLGPGDQACLLPTLQMSRVMQQHIM